MPPGRRSQAPDSREDIGFLGLFGEVATRLAAIAPRLQTPIQLAGFLFSILAAALIRFVDPGNVQSLVVVGAISVALVAIPLLFHPEILKVFRPDHRPIVVLATLIILLASFGVLATVTITSISNATLPARGALFDSKLEEPSVKVLGERPDGKHRVQLIWDIIPLSKSENESASVFIGMVVLHDDDLVNAEGIGQVSTRSCREVASCLGSRVFTEYLTNPLLVKGGSRGTTLTTAVDMEKRPKRLRIWWQLYQREGPAKGEQCAIDQSDAVTPDRMPRLATYRNQQRIGNPCYMSYGQRVVEL